MVPSLWAPGSLISLILLIGASAYSQGADSAQVTELGSTHVHAKHLDEEIINSKEWTSQQKSTLGASLDGVPGFQQRSLGSATSRPVFRGFGGEHIQMAEDGAEVKDLSATSPDHAVSSNPTLIKSVEILKGAELLPFSLSTVGARINSSRGVFLSPALPEWNGQASIAGESAQLGRNFSLNTELPVGEFVLRNQLSLGEHENLHTARSQLGNTYGQHWQVAQGLQYGLSGNMIGASFDLSSREYGVPGGFVGAHPEGVRIELDKAMANLGFDYYSGQWELKSFLNFNDYYQRETEVNGPIGAEFDVQDHSWRNELYYHISSNFDIQTGLELGLEDRKYGGRVYTPQTLRNTGASWLLLEYRPQNHWYRVGARVEGQTDELSGIYAQTGNLRGREMLAWSSYLEWGWIYDTNKTTDSKASLGAYRTSRLPTVEELYNEGPHLAAYSYDVGNIDLKPEEGYGAEFSVVHQIPFAEISAKAYYTYYPNFIYTRPTGNINWLNQLEVFQVDNAAAEMKGGDIRLNIPWGDYLKLRSSYEYTWAQDLGENQPVAFIPPWRLQNEIQFLSSWGDWSVISQWIGEQTRTSQFETVTPNAHLIHLQYFKMWSLNGYLMKAFVELNNVTDEFWQNHLSRIKSVYPEPGRAINARLELGF